MRNYTHISQMVLAGLHSLLWMFAPIVQLVLFLTVTPRFGMEAAWENVNITPRITPKTKGKKSRGSNICRHGLQGSLGASFLPPYSWPSPSMLSGTLF